MTIRGYVLQALQKDPATRSGDLPLVRRVFIDYAIDNDIPVEEAETVARLLLKFPSYRTLVRARAYVQAKHPELKDKKKAAERAAQEEICREEYSPKNKGGRPKTKPNQTVDLPAFRNDSPDIPEVDFLEVDPDQLKLYE